MGKLHDYPIHLTKENLTPSYRTKGLILFIPCVNLKPITLQWRRAREPPDSWLKKCMERTANMAPPYNANARAPAMIFGFMRYDLAAFIYYVLFADCSAMINKPYVYIYVWFIIYILLWFSCRCQGNWNQYPYVYVVYTVRTNSTVLRINVQQLL